MSHKYSSCLKIFLPENTTCKRCRDVAQWLSPCLLCMRPQVQSLYHKREWNEASHFFLPWSSPWSCTACTVHYKPAVAFKAQSSVPAFLSYGSAIVLTPWLVGGGKGDYVLSFLLMCGQLGERANDKRVSERLENVCCGCLAIKYLSSTIDRDVIRMDKVIYPEGVVSLWERTFQV